jgi:hypothetical protein
MSEASKSVESLTNGILYVGKLWLMEGSKSASFGEWKALCVERQENVNRSRSHTQTSQTLR